MQKPKTATPGRIGTAYHRGVLFVESVPQDTKALFKAACAKRQTTMRDALIHFMRDFISKTR